MRNCTEWDVRSDFQKEITLIFSPLHAVILFLWRHLSSIICFLYGESLFVGTLYSYTMLCAPGKQKEKLSYQWKCYHFFLMFSPLLFEKFPCTLLVLFSSASLNPLSPSHQKTHNKNQLKTKWKLLSTKKGQTYKFISIFNVSVMWCFFPKVSYWMEFYVTENFWAWQELLTKHILICWGNIFLS